MKDKGLREAAVILEDVVEDLGFEIEMILHRYIGDLRYLLMA